MGKKEHRFKSPGIFLTDGPEVHVNVKWVAIEFAKWVSNQQHMDDFWSMSSELQGEIYEYFINESGKDYA